MKLNAKTENIHLTGLRKQMKYDHGISWAHLSQMNDADSARGVIITSQFNA